MQQSQHRSSKSWSQHLEEEITMKVCKPLSSAVAIMAMASSVALAQQQGTGRAGAWEPRIPVKPDPSKIVVPKGYKAEVFADGLDTPSSATVDGNGNVWVAISDRCSPPAPIQPTSRCSIRAAS